MKERDRGGQERERGREGAEERERKRETERDRVYTGMSHLCYVYESSMLRCKGNWYRVVRLH